MEITSKKKDNCNNLVTGSDLINLFGSLLTHSIIASLALIHYCFLLLIFLILTLAFSRVKVLHVKYKSLLVKITYRSIFF